MAEAKPRLEWDSGTAYDFFASLFVLFRPDDFGLRASWAAGVRSRLSEDTRRFMTDVQHFAGVPATWIRGLPEPKDSKIAVQTLERMDPRDVARAMVCEYAPDHPHHQEILLGVIDRGAWTSADVDRLLEPKATLHERERMGRWLGWLSRPGDFGKALLEGMTEFREAFFREEERRIGPQLERALQEAREKSRTLAAADLLEDLTRGLRVSHLLDRDRLLLVPCYWCSPRIIYGDLAPGFRFILFGARPADASLIPEDEVPASLALAMTALSDPTRLNTLRLLRQEPLTQAEIARKLRLRPSTISHHLKSLRIAGLITYLESDGAELRYAARVAAVQEACAALGRFLSL